MQSYIFLKLKGLSLKGATTELRYCQYWSPAAAPKTRQGRKCTAMSILV